MKRYLEDVVLGERWNSAPFTVTEADIIDFGRKYDPQPFHIDAEAALDSPFGGLIASGWHLAALAMRVCVEGHLFGDIPIIGIGVDDLRWFAPVRPGDVLIVEREVVEIILLKDKPKRGTVKARLALKNQRGELIMQMYGLTSVPKTPPGTIEGQGN
jgi:acyl dehydratase